MSEPLRFLATYRLEDWRLRVRIHYNDGTYLGETHTKHRDVSLVRGVAESYVAAFLGIDSQEELDRLSIGVHGARIKRRRKRAAKVAVCRPKLDHGRVLAVARGCPTPGKAAFDSRYDAERFLARSWSRLVPGGYAAVRVYDDCPCGMLHLTSWSESYQKVSA